jgi:prepilin peptidase CpaA
MGFLLHIISWLASLLLLARSAGTDLKERRIPNELVAAVAVIGLALGLIARPGLVWFSLLVAVVVFCGLGVLSHYKFIGGGDLKLISAVTLLVPPERVGQLLIEIALAGGVLSCFYLAARYALKSLPASPTGAVEIASPKIGLVLAIKTERGRIAAGDPLPYALAVLGGVCIYIAREFFQCFYAMSCSL